MNNNKDNLQALRHSAEHVLTQAMLKLFPKIKMAMGPATDDGFYFDFDPNGEKISEDDFPKIEAEMQKIVKKDLPIKKEEIDISAAKKLFTNNEYKLEWIKEIEKKGEKASVYWTGEEFVDLCKGPHVSSTGKIKVFKLLSIAGAYWHGDEKNKMLTRIYATAFENKDGLQKYLNFLEESKKRDHRKIAKDMDLFSIDDFVGPGLILWHPKLSVVREEIETYWRREHRKRGYQYIYTPHVGLDNLWKISGHLEFYKETMYPPMSMESKNKDEKTCYYAKPMSCPFHIRIYKSRPRSYKELPLRWCELGSVYRYEESGVLHGMLRVRGFTQDDAHIFCREDQFIEEVNEVLDFALEMNKAFGFINLKVYLSVRNPEDKNKYVGEKRVWDLSEKTLEKILKERKIPYQKDVGGAKFYGPAIDLKVVDVLGREWQGTTIQLDMNLPSKFQMTYISDDGKEHTPIMLHRTLLGSMERFVGTLIEHYAGNFPTWLTPVQVKVLPITDRNLKYAKEVYEKLKHEEIRVELDDRNETLGAKIRDAQMEKVAYMLIVGDKEEKEGSISERGRSGKDYGQLKLEEFIKNIKEEIDKKIIN